jgi:hypothetical protein
MPKNNLRKMSGVTQKKNHKKILCTDFNSVWWKCMMFACQFDNNSFALLFFEGVCHSNSKIESKVYIDTATTSGVRSWSTA